MTATAAPQRPSISQQIALAAPAEAPVAASDVCDLIEAAGPLTLCDIAGGLGVPASRASDRVRAMRHCGQLKRDEFSRYRLSGACAAG